MLGWILIFTIMVLLTALLGFTGIISVAAAFAKVVFWILVVLFLVVLVMSLVGQTDRGAVR